MRFLHSFFKTTHPIQHRTLFHFTKERPELLCANFTGIFGALSALHQQGRHKHPNLRIICTPFWMDQVHPCYLNEHWGQTIYGLPKIVRDLWHDVHPHHDDQQYLKWHEIRAMRAIALKILSEDYSIPIVYGEPNVTRTEEGQFEVTVSENQQVTHQFHLPSDTHFYIWYKVPRLYVINDFVQRPSTHLYQKPPIAYVNDQSIIVLGSGLSVAWLARHFANDFYQNRRIICLKFTQDEMPRIPGNHDIDYSRIIFLNVHDVAISPSRQDPHYVEVVCLKTGRKFQGPFFSSIGFEVPSIPFEAIPTAQKTMPVFWKKRAFYAAQNIPQGSMMHSLLQFYEMTDNLFWGFEAQSHHDIANYFETKILPFFSPSLKLDIRYWHALQLKVGSLVNPVPDQEVPIMLTSLYRETYGPTLAQTILFEQELKQFLQKQAPHFVMSDDVWREVSYLS